MSRYNLIKEICVAQLPVSFSELDRMQLELYCDGAGLVLGRRKLPKLSLLVPSVVVRDIYGKYTVLKAIKRFYEFYVVEKCSVISYRLSYWLKDSSKPSNIDIIKIQLKRGKVALVHNVKNRYLFFKWKRGRKDWYLVEQRVADGEFLFIEDQRRVFEGYSYSEIFSILEKMKNRDWTDQFIKCTNCNNLTRLRYCKKGLYCAFCGKLIRLYAPELKKSKKRLIVRKISTDNKIIGFGHQLFRIIDKKLKYVKTAGERTNRLELEWRSGRKLHHTISVLNENAEFYYTLRDENDVRIWSIVPDGHDVVLKIQSNNHWTEGFGLIYVFLKANQSLQIIHRNPDLKN